MQHNNEGMERQTEEKRKKKGRAAGKIHGVKWTKEKMVVEREREKTVQWRRIHKAMKVTWNRSMCKKENRKRNRGKMEIDE